jgi:hypothetical protein
VTNGANQINNIEFYLSEDREAEYKNQALSAATKNAKEKAKTIASSLDARLGKIVSVSESNFYYAPYRYSMEAAVDTDEAVAQVAKVTPMDVNVQASINVVYEIR